MHGQKNIKKYENCITGAFRHQQVFNLFIAYDDVRIAVIFTSITFSHVRFEFYNPALNHQNTTNIHRISWSNGRHS